MEQGVTWPVLKEAPWGAEEAGRARDRLMLDLRKIRNAQARSRTGRLRCVLDLASSGSRKDRSMERNSASPSGLAADLGWRGVPGYLPSGSSRRAVQRLALVSASLSR